MGTPFHRAMTLISQTPDLSWQEHAACAGSDPEAWYGDGHDTAAAVAICQTCPVRTRCLDWARANGEQWGIWGGVALGGTKQPQTEPRTCKNGHPRTPENTSVRRDGKRGECKVCHRERAAARRKGTSSAA